MADLKFVHRRLLDDAGRGILRCDHRGVTMCDRPGNTGAHPVKAAHIEHLVALGLLAKDSRDFWRPVTEAPDA